MSREPSWPRSDHRLHSFPSDFSSEPPRRLRDRRGFLTGIFLCGYGVARMLGELFREPDANIGFLVSGATMGQILSIPMVVLGLWLMARAKSPVPSSLCSSQSRFR